MGRCNFARNAACCPAKTADTLSCTVAEKEEKFLELLFSSSALIRGCLLLICHREDEVFGRRATPPLEQSYAFSMTLVVKVFPFQMDLYCSGTGISM